MPLPSNPVYVRLDQLRIGVFVCLELNWLDHNFARNSFKIKSAEQLAELQQLGLTEKTIEPMNLEDIFVTTIRAGATL